MSSRRRRSQRRASVPTRSGSLRTMEPLDHRRGLRPWRRPDRLGSALPLPHAVRRRGRDGGLPATVTTHDWNQAQDAGRPWADAIEELAARHPEQRDLIEAYWRRWPETLGDAIEPTVAMLDELRSTGIRLFALSNWSGETFPLARPRYPFLDWFDGIVISGDERLAKPDPRIFEVLLDRYGLVRRARRCSSTTTPRMSRPRPRSASRPSGSSARPTSGPTSNASAS